MMEKECIKLLVLDGTSIYGKQTMDGTKYIALSDDKNCKDNYKIGKFYNSQRWIRYDSILYENSDGKVQLRLCKPDEIPNSYIVCSKRAFREKTNQIKAETAIIQCQVKFAVCNFIAYKNKLFSNILN